MEEEGKRNDVISRILESIPRCIDCRWSRCYIRVDKHGKSETHWHCLNWHDRTDEDGYCYKWGKRV